MSIVPAVEDGTQLDASTRGSSRVVNMRFVDALHETKIKAWTTSATEPKRKTHEYALKTYYGGFGGPTPIFGQQCNEQGAVVFYCQPWPSFFADYVKMSEKKRMHHEVVREGRPCKVFVDIEDETIEGTEEAFAAARRRVAAFIDWVEEKIDAYWPELRRDAQTLGEPFDDVVWMDSSDVATPKFSVHLTFNLVGNTMFATNEHLMRFMHWLANASYDEGHPAATHMPSADALVASLAAATAAGDEKALCALSAQSLSSLFMADMNVYIKGEHNLRLAFSHKMSAAHRVLRPYSLEMDRVDTEPLATTHEHVFYRSLIGYQPRAATVHRLLVCEYIRTFALRVGGSLKDGYWSRLHSNGGEDDYVEDNIRIDGIVLSRKRLRSSLTSSTSLNPPSLTTSTGRSLGGSDIEDYFPTSRSASALASVRQHVVVTDTETRIVRTTRRILSAEERIECFKSLLPRLMEDILTQIEGSVNLKLIKYIPEDGCVILGSLGHYCEIKGDTHRHNHVYYVCFLGSAVFYQRCPHSECLQRYLTSRTWGPTGPPSHLRHARGTSYMFDPSLWADSRRLVDGVEHTQQELNEDGTVIPNTEGPLAKRSRYEDSCITPQSPGFERYAQHAGSSDMEVDEVAAHHAVDDMMNMFDAQLGDF